MDNLSKSFDPFWFSIKVSLATSPNFHHNVTMIFRVLSPSQSTYSKCTRPFTSLCALKITDYTSPPLASAVTSQSSSIKKVTPKRTEKIAISKPRKKCHSLNCHAPTPLHRHSCWLEHFLGISNCDIDTFFCAAISFEKGLRPCRWCEKNGSVLSALGSENVDCHFYPQNHRAWNRFFFFSALCSRVSLSVAHGFTKVTRSTSPVSTAALVASGDKTSGAHNGGWWQVVISGGKWRQVWRQVVTVVDGQRIGGQRLQWLVLAVPLFVTLPRPLCPELYSQ